MAVEFFARVDDATGMLYGFGGPALSGAGPGQSIVSIGILPFVPDRRTKRYDGAGGIRDATAQEISDYDSDALDREASRNIDEMKAFKALALVLADEVAKTPAQIRAAVIAKYKSLP